MYLKKILRAKFSVLLNYTSMFLSNAACRVFIIFLTEVLLLVCSWLSWCSEIHCATVRGFSKQEKRSLFHFWIRTQLGCMCIYPGSFLCAFSPLRKVNVKSSYHLFVNLIQSIINQQCGFIAKYFARIRY